MEDRSSASPGRVSLVVAQRPGRRAAAIGALVCLAGLAVLVLFIILVNLRLVLSLVAAFAVFFAGTWGMLARREWLRWVFAAGAAVGAVAILAIAISIGWVSTGATLLTFALVGVFSGLTRYALGDRVEVEV